MTQVPLMGPGNDGQYDHTHPWQPMLPTWAQNRPWATHEERLTTQALQVALASGPEVQDTIRCPLPQVDVFRPRFGYRDYQIGIADIVDVDRIYPQEPRDDFSGGAAGYQGTARNAWNTGDF